MDKSIKSFLLKGPAFRSICLRYPGHCTRAFDFSSHKSIQSSLSSNVASWSISQLKVLFQFIQSTSTLDTIVWTLDADKVTRQWKKIWIVNCSPSWAQNTANCTSCKTHKTLFGLLGLIDLFIYFCFGFLAAKRAREIT